MTTPIKNIPTDWESQLDDRHRVRRFKQVLDHYPKRATLFWRLYGGKTTPRECIKAFCLECNGWEEAAIRHCPSTACPIFKFRPYQAKVKEAK